VRNIIFDLGGVVLEWNPDAILETYYVDPGARASMKAALFQHPDWLLMDRGVLTEAEALARLGARTGIPSMELVGLFEAVRTSLQPKEDGMTAATVFTIQEHEDTATPVEPPAVSAGCFTLSTAKTHGPVGEFSFGDWLSENHPHFALVPENRTANGIDLGRFAFEQLQEAAANVKHHS
jgi:hypothetical protein